MVNSSNDVAIEVFCKRGQEIDAKLAVYSPSVLEEMKNDYNTLLNEMVQGGKIDSYILQKICISYLRVLIISNDSHTALEIWMQSNEKYALWNMGMLSLENVPSISEHDMMLFMQMMAYLNSSNLVVDSADGKRIKVDYWMDKLSESYISKNKIQDFISMLGNWKYLLKKIHESEENIPRDSKFFIYFNKLPDDLRGKLPDKLYFSEPDRWVIPEGNVISIGSNNHTLSSEDTINGNNLLQNAVPTINGDPLTKNLVVGDVGVNYGELKKENIFIKLFSINGRINRIQFLLRIIAIIGIFSFIITVAIVFGLIPSIPDFPIFYLFIPIAVKRLHDLDYKGWWLLIPLVFLIIIFLPGTKGDNRFGPVPR